MRKALVDLDMSILAGGKAESRVGLDVGKAWVGWDKDIRSSKN